MAVQVKDCWTPAPHRRRVIDQGADGQASNNRRGRKPRDAQLRDELAAAMAIRPARLVLQS